MGLSLHWEFASSVLEASAATAWVRSLREYAATFPFGEVSEVVEAWADRRDVGGGGGEGDESAMADRAWALSQGMAVRAAPTPEDPTRTRRVAPLHVAAFRVYVAGAEEAVFGLASHGEGGEYVWSGGCATQGAATRGGAAAFLAAHRSVVAVLDKARALGGGVGVVVRDDGGFWESRDPKVLLDRLAEWESLTTAIARGRGGGAKVKVTPLASEMKDVLEARRRARPRLDKPPAEELEG